MPLPSRTRSSWEHLHEAYTHLPDFQQERLAQMGFGHFLQIQPFEIQLGLLVPFAKRFHGPSGSFVLRVGEMLITLEDVVRLVGLRVGRVPLIADWQLCYGDVLEACYGLHPPRSGRYHTCVNQPMLTQCFEDLLFADVDLPAVADQQLRVFLSILFHQLFFGTSSQMLHAGFAPFILDVERIGSYSWGSAMLAYLLSRLEAFSTGRTHSLSGCLPLF